MKLHQKYPANQQFLAGKQPRPVEYKQPEDFPSLQGKYKDKLDYAGKVVQSCLHCHQIRDAERQVYRDLGKPLPERVLYPYPMPEVIGFSLDPNTRGTVTAVTPGSPAADAGIKQGDELLTLDGQALLSIADVQWVLQNTDSAAALKASLHRGDEHLDVTITLDEGWRRQSDIGWRVTSWPLRRMVTGGLKLDELPDEGRARYKLDDDDLALLVEHVGQYGPHAAAKRAGFQKGDIIVDVAGESSRMRESDLLAHLMQRTRPGEKVAVTVLRNGRRMSLSLPMQK